MYVPYGMYKRVAVVTHVSDEKSIETEDGDGKLKFQVKHTFVLNFFSLSLFLSLSLHGAEVATLHTHTLSLSCLCIPAALPNPHYKNKSFLFGGKIKRPSRPIGGKNDGKEKLKINIVHTATAHQVIKI